MLRRKSSGAAVHAGISMAISGDVVVTGGQTAPATSVYSVDGREWLRAPPMNIARAYQSSATLSDGKVSLRY